MQHIFILLSIIIIEYNFFSISFTIYLNFINVSYIEKKNIFKIIDIKLINNLLIIIDNKLITNSLVIIDNKLITNLLTIIDNN